MSALAPSKYPTSNNNKQAQLKIFNFYVIYLRQKATKYELFQSVLYYAPIWCQAGSRSDKKNLENQRIS